MVVVLDETCHERDYHKDNIQNGSSHTDEDIEGILSRRDVDMLLTMFDTGQSHFASEVNFSVVTTPSSTKCLSILTPDLSAKVPPPTLFLAPLSPASLADSSLGIDTAPSESSSHSSISHRKHPQSNSSDKPSLYGPEFLQLLHQSPHGTAHIIPVALCRRTDRWSKSDLVKLLDLGVRDILNVPCEAANVSGLYMVIFLLSDLIVAFARPYSESVGRGSGVTTISESTTCS